MMTRAVANRMSQPRILGRGFLICSCMVVGCYGEGRACAC